MSEQPTPRETRFASINTKLRNSSATKDDKLGEAFELRLAKQLEDYNTQLKSLILETHQNLIGKFDQIVTEFNSRFEDVNRSLSTLTVRIEVLEQTSESILCSQLDSEILMLRGKIDVMERDKLSTDVILHAAQCSA